jgi:hypothetical protein
MDGLEVGWVVFVLVALLAALVLVSGPVLSSLAGALAGCVLAWRRAK